MPYRTPTRWLAPLALLAAVVAVFVVVSGSTGGDSDEDRSASTSTSTTARSKPKPDRETNTRTSTDTSDTTETTGTQTTPLNGQRTYTVRPGDTLAAIAEQTGVSVEQLQELNPDLDPNSMSVGDEIKLVE
jgi:LysM repeat protein